MMNQQELRELVSFLKSHKLKLSTAESCTSGYIIHLLSKVPKSGEVLDTGFVVYSEEAKLKVLGVKKKTIKNFNLTSEEVAREMVQGALRYTQANIAVASTGIAGSKPMDGIPPGTICFAWLIKHNSKNILVSETVLFKGSKSQKQKLAAAYALKQIPFYFNKLISELNEKE
ncbi:nicotinamide-nucleotide amidohydrolase family protein [Fluoribacter dumoffii]|uniref:CinA family protein n=2 Tax=Fluoribacter dumoffii TaxID=463 RepID=UPI001E2C4E07|nr:nicotinamide-nucleotide amidohydrolase family protein [Fluoribacter dumoffii]MCW8418513.1 nicotinamide-nucleotide amidohydrolase family protein [Fluoribacter dumoffii]MCW8453645.1 nicotinamide-nucleotide amidohydrolase family protein [Fluoribacter dumoffii]MCW8459137.1 nicotinamide-nucleotide amidohydrolase family protein [Fluoribacter dumoffii]MCW8482496.1 nicotinamide-nucleotide amidohydrolase family protein [Fluoribacter dumoffii]